MRLETKPGSSLGCSLWIPISLTYCFVDPLSSYKHKDDLVTLAGALALKTIARSTTS